MKPRLGITLGDGAGVGPEIILKLLHRPALYKICQPVLIGHLPLLEFWSRHLHLKIPKKVSLIDCDVAKKRIRPGKVDPEMGKAAIAFVRQGVQSLLKKEIDGMVTAPLCKEAVQKGGMTSFVGHTEYLAELSHSKEVSMMFVGGGFKMVLATIHIPLKQVPAALTQKKVLQAISHAHLAGNLFGVKNPHIAVAGLNPHAGEAGLMGQEEIRVIGPAMAQAKKKGWQVTGPYPPDTLFYQARKKEAFDVIVVMYHDQGLIPLKMIAFETSVNVTLGLPFVRTSPDHGTAFEIAGKGVANPSSMWEAIKVAVKLTNV